MQSKKNRAVKELAALRSYLRRRFFSLAAQTNVCKTSHARNLLVSYISHPFRRFKPGTGHTNATEVVLIASTFSRAGFNVDVVDFDYEGPIDYSKYSAVIGLGVPLENSFLYDGPLLRVAYLTEAPWENASAALAERVEDFRRESGILALESVRFPVVFPRQNFFCDAVVCIGRKPLPSVHIPRPKPIFYLNVTANQRAFKTARAAPPSEEAKRGRGFVWFASNAAIHRGLDLLISCFRQYPELTLTVVGSVQDERSFMAWAKRTAPQNVEFTGFLHVDSPRLNEVIARAAFLIFPSIAEGQPSAVATGMAYGLIPITSKACSMEISDFGFELKDVSSQSLNEAVEWSISLSDRDVQQRRARAVEYAKCKHHPEVFMRDFSEVAEYVAREARIT